jgi:hypothetical protein
MLLTLGNDLVITIEMKTLLQAKANISKINETKAKKRFFSIE